MRRSSKSINIINVYIFHVKFNSMGIMYTNKSLSLVDSSKGVAAIFLDIAVAHKQGE